MHRTRNLFLDTSDPGFYYEEICIYRELCEIVLDLSPKFLRILLFLPIIYIRSMEFYAYDIKIPLVSQKNWWRE
jgi:hypothetical protein